MFVSFEYLDFFDFHLHPPPFAYACSDKENSIIWLNNRRMGLDLLCFKETGAGYPPSTFIPEIFVYFGWFVSFFYIYFIFSIFFKKKNKKKTLPHFIRSHTAYILLVFLFIILQCRFPWGDRALLIFTPRSAPNHGGNLHEQNRIGKCRH